MIQPSINDIISYCKDCELVYIDLFCGAGGVTCGIERVNGARTIYAVNHDPLAISSHFNNYPFVFHDVEDIRTLDLKVLIDLVQELRRHYPDIKIALWASLECTHFSKVKGGDHREADSRTLANHLLRYIELINPDFIDIENVVEFMSWGPLRVKCLKSLSDRSELCVRADKSYHMVPNSRKNGKFYNLWVNEICTKFDYQYDYRILNSANYGAYTSRKRYFGQFIKKDNSLSFTWPVQTHARKYDKTILFGDLKPWNPVKKVLNFELECKSIFYRKKELCLKTYERIFNGFVKHILLGELPSIFGNVDWNSNKSISDNIQSTNGNVLKEHSWLDKQYRGSDNHQSITMPAGSILTNDKHCLMSVDRSNSFIMNQYTSGGSDRSIEEPLSTITTVPKSNFIKAERWLFNHNYSNPGNSINEPCPTLLASRKHYYLSEIQESNNTMQISFKDDSEYEKDLNMASNYPIIYIYKNDLEVVKKLKFLMAVNGISDIKMRMLSVDELKRIQGFGESYILDGSQTNQKKFIGNSVPPDVVEAWVEERVNNLRKAKSVAA